MNNKPLVVACIPAFNEERTIGGVVVRALRFVDRVVVCDDGSVDLTGAIAETTGFYVSRSVVSFGEGYDNAEDKLGVEASTYDVMKRVENLEREVNRLKALIPFGLETLNFTLVSFRGTAELLVSMDELARSIEYYASH